MPSSVFSFCGETYSEANSLSHIFSEACNAILSSSSFSFPFVFMPTYL